MKKNLSTLTLLTAALLLSSTAYAGDTDSWDSGTGGGNPQVDSPSTGNGNTGNYSFDASRMNTTTSPTPSGWSAVSGSNTPSLDTVEQDDTPTKSFKMGNPTTQDSAAFDQGLNNLKITSDESKLALAKPIVTAGTTENNGAKYDEVSDKATQAVDGFNWRNKKK